MKVASDVMLNKIVQRLKNHSNVIDVTDKIALSWDAGTGGGTQLTFYEATPNKYIYAPDLGIVFFMIDVCFKGTMKADEPIPFIHVGGYAPSDGIGAFGITSSKHADKLWLTYETIGDEKSLGIRPNTDISSPTGFYDHIYLSGWYFCDGE